MLCSAPSKDAEMFLRTQEVKYPLLALWRMRSNGGKRRGFFEKARSTALNLKNWSYAFRNASQPKDGQVIFYASSHTPATLGAIIPMMRKLVERGTFPLMIVNSATADPVRGLMPKGTLDYRWLLASLNTTQRKTAREKAQHLSAILADVFREDYDENFVEVFETAAQMEEAGSTFLRGAGALIMETDFFPVAKGLALGARRANVPVIEVQHGFFGPHQFPMQCDKLLCFGNYFRREAIQYGMGVNIPQATGCPRWDAIETMRRCDRNPDIRARLGGGNRQPVVLLISDAQGKQWHKNLYKRYFESVSRLLESNLSVAVRFHPCENGLSNYVGEISESLLRKLMPVPDDISLWDAIRHADVAYNVISTGSMEALLLDVPVLFTAPEGQHKLTELPDHGGGAWCDEKEIVKLCHSFGSEGQERTEILERQARFLDDAIANRGNATEECLNAVCRTTAKRADVIFK